MTFVDDVNPDDLTFLAERLESGDLKAMISRRWKLNQVAEAMRISGTGRARGKMVIHIGE